ncbi:hypothetical protein PGT21_009154 [Puccinia graminis f. sp. tritici]|uniref:Hydrophobin n=1 Tax=Puccinia graminis f. sp. tritici TaxID=56615 RepID=A0A5B0SG82_PUCGR|nr:hypothetical protein PGT21_009154 [Puccinia graminis f. sp. tritici]KAA1136877.1 hypothetical protein PGTUg99_004442 [Puccinia graminis f. sp. tritici]
MHLLASIIILLSISLNLEASSRVTPSPNFQCNDPSRPLVVCGLKYTDEDTGAKWYSLAGPTIVRQKYKQYNCGYTDMLCCADYTISRIRAEPTTIYQSTVNQWCVTGTIAK